MKLEVNPFRWNQIDIDLFVGRGDLLSDVLKGVKRGDSFAIVGGRRIGKTMFLRKVEDVLAQFALTATSLLTIPVYVNAQQFQVPLELRGFYRAVIQGIVARLTDLRLGGSLEAWFSSSADAERETSLFRDQMVNLTKLLPSYLQLVVLIDEIEPILDTDWGRGFCDNWRQLLHNDPDLSPHLSTVMVGGKEMSRIALDVGSPLSNVLTWKYLTVFDERETTELICKPTGDGVDLQTITRIFDETGGHPFLIQYVMSALAEDDLDKASAGVGHAVERFFDEQVILFRSLWGKLDDSERRVYAFLACQSRAVAAGEVMAAVGRNPTALDTLCQFGIVRYTPATRAYEAAGRMFARWFLYEAKGVPSVSPLSEEVRQSAPAIHGESRSVFLVHGHDIGTRDAVARYLQQLDLAPIILAEQPNRGGTIIEKLEANSTVPFVVVLLTGDDRGVAAKEQKRRVNKLQKRARQNVIFELGYFVAKVGRNRVCTLYASGVEIPSDISGVMFVEYDDGGGWRVELARELSAAGIEVDLNRVVGGGSRTAD